MNEAWKLLAVAVAGLLLGGIFFGGLWWTVRKGLTAKQPALWFVSSLVLRMGLVLIGLYYLASNAWQNLLAALLGLVLARWLVMRLTKEENLHASQS